jgi:hypothetical protein
MPPRLTADCASGCKRNLGVAAPVPVHSSAAHPRSQCKPQPSGACSAASFIILNPPSSAPAPVLSHLSRPAGAPNPPPAPAPRLPTSPPPVVACVAAASRTAPPPSPRPHTAHRIHRRHDEQELPRLPRQPADRRHAVAHKGPRPVRAAQLHPAPHAPQVAGHQVTDTQSPVRHVVHRRARDVAVALGHAQVAAHTPVVDIRRAVPVPRHRRHLRPVCQRVAGAVCEDVYCRPAHDGPVSSHYSTVPSSAAPHPYVGASILKLQVRHPRAPAPRSGVLAGCPARNQRQRLHFLTTKYLTWALTVILQIHLR